MKNSILVCLAVSFLATTSTEAQFLKNLTKKVTNKVENVVTGNISDKAAKEADEALNKIWETDLKNMDFGMGEPVDPAEIPESYNFDWKYSMKMKSESGEMDFSYRLKKDANYMGIEIPDMKNFLMVMDRGKNISVMFMDGMVRATRLNPEELSEPPVENHFKDLEYQKIDTKKILGYQCEGYKAENEDYVFVFYITEDAGIGFSEFYRNQKNIPKGFDPDWISENSLLMEMEMVDKKVPSNNMTMVCTNIEKENFSISK